jgi:hypothetical protein
VGDGHLFLERCIMQSVSLTAELAMMYGKLSFSLECEEFWS